MSITTSEEGSAFFPQYARSDVLHLVDNIDIGDLLEHIKHGYRMKNYAVVHAKRA